VCVCLCVCSKVKPSAKHLRVHPGAYLRESSGGLSTPSRKFLMIKSGKNYQNHGKLWNPLRRILDTPLPSMTSSNLKIALSFEQDVLWRWLTPHWKGNNIWDVTVMVSRYLDTVLAHLWRHRNLKLQYLLSKKWGWFLIGKGVR